jgi:hypothetical protein
VGRLPLRDAVALGDTRREMSALTELAALLMTEPASTTTLLAKHVDDGQGKCRGCTLPQRGYQPWPCAIHIAATMAAESLGRGPSRGGT